MRSVVSALCLIAILIGCDSAKSPPKTEPPAPKPELGSATAEPKTTADEETSPKPAAETESTAATADAKESDGDKTPIRDTSTPLSRLSPEDVAGGWIALFDGETLFGWKPNSELNWRVEDSVIIADEGKPGLLLTTSRFADYELKCDFRLEAGGNSGVFLRTTTEPTDPAVDCYELNICDTHPAFASGSLVKRAQPEKAIQADGEWHTFHVVAAGPKITVDFDGEEILDFIDETETRLEIGHIGLQMNGGKVEFKNVFLKPLSMQPLFDGTSLAGWQVVPGSQSEFVVEDETIHVTNGRGFLETEATAKNFVLQFEAITNGDKLNSGVFFRAMPGTEDAPSNGYEFQIQNGFKDDDRAKPDDFGTGAIFRRAAARKVVSNDREWFTATLIADGPHFATWVDGYPVVDWTDEREPNVNPRNGLRLEAGHFSLQGHDPGTDLNFRNLRIESLPE